MTEHVLTEVSVQRYTMEIRPDDITEDSISIEELGLEFQEELSHKYECSCGDKFLKAHTAHEHLLDVSSNDSVFEEGDVDG